MSEYQTYILYYLIIIITSLIIFVSDRVKERNISKLFFLIAILIPVVISGFRYGIGTDYFNYVDIYYILTETGDLLYHLLNSRLEPGWIILNYLIYLTFDDVKFIFIISSLLIIVCSFIAVYQNRQYISIPIAIFILLVIILNPSFNLIRLYLAAAIVLLSVKAIINKQFVRFSLIVLLASTFHYSVLIFFIVYWLVNSKYETFGKIKRILGIILTMLFILFAEYLFTFITNISVFSTYSRYTLEFDGLGLGVIILDVPIILMIVINLRKLKSTNNRMYAFSYIYFMGIVLSFIGYLADYAGRISTYFELLQVFIISAIIKVQSNRHKKFLYLIFIIFYYLSLYTYNYVIHNAHRTIPYVWLP